MRTSHLFSTTRTVSGMKERHLRVVVAMASLLLLDLVKPLGYSLSVEFLFLGVLAIFIIYPYLPALLWAVVFGYLSDCISASTAPIVSIELFCIFFMVRYLSGQLNENSFKGYLLPISAIIVHIMVNSSQVSAVGLMFLINTFIQSMTVYLLLKYLMQKWMKFIPAGFSL